MREPVIEQTRDTERNKEQRECNAEINENLREPITITLDNDDFAPDPTSPIESDFTLLPSSKRDIE